MCPVKALRGHLLSDVRFVGPMHRAPPRLTRVSSPGRCYGQCRCITMDGSGYFDKVGGSEQPQLLHRLRGWGALVTAAAALVAANGALLVLMAASAPSYFSTHSGGGPGVTLACGIVVAGLVTGAATLRSGLRDRSPACGLRLLRAVGVVASATLLCAGALLVALLAGSR